MPGRPVSPWVVEPALAVGTMLVGAACFFGTDWLASHDSLTTWLVFPWILPAAALLRSGLWRPWLALPMLLTGGALALYVVQGWHYPNKPGVALATVQWVMVVWVPVAATGLMLMLCLREGWRQAWCPVDLVTRPPG